MLFPKIKLCLVGVPKNASESLHQALIEQLDMKRIHEHVPMSHLLIENGMRELQEYYKVATVRNPYERFYSAYRFLRHNDGWKLTIDETLDGLEAIQEEDPSMIYLSVNPVLLSQSMFIFDATGKRLVDRLLRFETLDENWDDLMAYVNATHGTDLQGGLPTINSANNGSVWYKELSTAQLLRISKIYHDDFINLGYSKDFLQLLQDNR